MTTDPIATEQPGQTARLTADTAAEQGKHVVSTAKEEAATVAAEASTQARGVVDDALAQVGDRSRTHQVKLAGTLRSLGDDLESMAAQAPGIASDVALQVAGQVRGVASHLEDREPGELLGDVRSFARRRPGIFLLGSLVAGVVAGRLLRGTADGITAATQAGVDRSPAPTTAHTPAPEPTGLAGTGTLTTTGSIGGYGLNQPEVDDLLAAPATGHTTGSTGSATGSTADIGRPAEDFLK